MYADLLNRLRESAQEMRDDSERTGYIEPDALLDEAADVIEQTTQLLLKYIAHVAVAEGINFATDINLSPADMGDLHFTEEEVQQLQKEFFPLVGKSVV